MLKHVSLLAFVGLTLRIVALGATLGDSIAIFALAGLFAYEKYLEINKVLPLNDEIKQEINVLKGQIAVLQINKGMKTSSNEQSQANKRYF